MTVVDHGITALRPTSSNVEDTSLKEEEKKNPRSRGYVISILSVPGPTQVSPGIVDGSPYYAFGGFDYVEFLPTNGVSHYSFRYPDHPNYAFPGQRHMIVWTS